MKTKTQKFIKIPSNRTHDPHANSLVYYPMDNQGTISLICAQLFYIKNHGFTDLIIVLSTKMFI